MSNVYRHKDGSYRDYPETVEQVATFDTSFNLCEVAVYQPNGYPNVVLHKDQTNVNVGKKHDQGKPPIHMIPEDAILGMAEAFAYGAKKYDRFNYRNGLDYTRLTDSLMRHTLAYLKGEDIDPESGLHHTKMILANAAMIEYMRLHKPEHDDRYKK